MKNKLALLGGEALITKTLNDFSLPVVPEKAYKTVEQLMRKGEISTSPIVNEFEGKFSSYIGCKYGLCTTNGTTAIQAGLFGVGVGPGDEVIVPSYTFWATVGPVVACRAVPVFADVDIDNYCLTAETIEKCITPRTKAILVVHVWGTPAHMDGIMAVAKKHNLKVVEDCSHAHGATYHGKKVGSIGDVGCFSMQGTKTLAAGEGGILVTNDRTVYERAAALGHYERLRGLPEDSEYRKYMLTGFGYKHRIAPLSVAIADASLEKLDELNAIRTANAKYFEDLLEGVGYMKMQTFDSDATRIYSYHNATFMPEKLGGVSPVTLLDALASEGVTCGSCGYGRLHTAPLFTDNGPWGNDCPFACPKYEGTREIPSLPVTEMLAENTIMIAPRFEIAQRSDIERYAEAYYKVLENVDELVEYDLKVNAQKSKLVNNAGTSINYYKKK